MQCDHNTTQHHNTTCMCAMHMMPVSWCRQLHRAEGRYLHGPSPGQAGLQDELLGVVFSARHTHNTTPACAHSTIDIGKPQN